MKERLIFAVVAPLFVLGVDCDAAARETADVFIGTSGLGHLTPAATYPFGAVQAGPDTSESEKKPSINWRHCSGYQHDDPFIWRFSQTHFFGTGGTSLGDIAILPCANGFDAMDRATTKRKGSESGEPGFYAVTIEEDGVPIRCEVAALAHSAVYRFTFPKGTHASLLLDLDWGLGWRGDHGEYPLNMSVVNSSCEFDGIGMTSVKGGHKVIAWGNYEFFFSMGFSHPVVSVKTRREHDGWRGDVREIDFGRLEDDVLEVRVGLSISSADAAERNLTNELAGLDFAAVKARGAAAWEDHLGRIELDPSTPDPIRRNFLSALYRTFVQPNDLGDVGGKPRYSTFSLWDTFRAVHPLYTLVTPERVPGFIVSMLDQCDRQGYLPIWAFAETENHCMIGHHAVPVVVDAYLKGLLPDGQVARAYRAVRQSLTVVHRGINNAGGGLTKEDWDVLDRYGYYPFDKLGGTYEGKPVCGESVSRTLECAYDDACAARFAEALGKKKDAEFFAKRSENWRNVYDASTGFMRGRDSNGKWREPFSPYAMGLGAGRDNDFCEGNSYQYTWHVLHNPKGLVELLGGKSKAGGRLDELFTARATDHAVDGDDGNCTGCIGQYAHGNEPSHHVAYFYIYTDQPWKTAEIVRKVFDTQYSPTPEGLCGNDDCGQMAAWYVFSALGFYPFDPCGGEYVIGAPQVPQAKLTLANGKVFTMTARNLSRENKYVKSVMLNGKKITDWKIRHADIMNGGELVFEMGK